MNGVFIYREFLDIRNTFNSRYVRLYGKIRCIMDIVHDVDSLMPLGACDRTGFYNDIVDAAWAR
jgi:hypothetical protein